MGDASRSFSASEEIKGRRLRSADIVWMIRRERQTRKRAQSQLVSLRSSLAFSPAGSLWEEGGAGAGEGEGREQGGEDKPKLYRKPSLLSSSSSRAQRKSFPDLSAARNESIDLLAGRLSMEEPFWNRRSAMLSIRAGASSRSSGDLQPGAPTRSGGGSAGAGAGAGAGGGGSRAFTSSSTRLQAASAEEWNQVCQVRTRRSG